MKQEIDDSQKLLLGLVIGGVLGAGALYYICSVQNRPTPILKRMGRTISDVGHRLENCEIQNTSDVIHKIEQQLPNGAEIANSFTDWLETGLSLWNKIKKG